MPLAVRLRLRRSSRANTMERGTEEPQDAWRIVGTIQSVRIALETALKSTRERNVNRRSTLGLDLVVGEVASGLGEVGIRARLLVAAVRVGREVHLLPTPPTDRDLHFVPRHSLVSSPIPTIESSKDGARSVAFQNTLPSSKSPTPSPPISQTPTELKTAARRWTVSLAPPSRCSTAAPTDQSRRKAPTVSVCVSFSGTTVRFKHPIWVRSREFPTYSRQVYVGSPENTLHTYTLESLAHLVYDTLSKTPNVEFSIDTVETLKRTGTLRATCVPTQRHPDLQISFDGNYGTFQASDFESARVQKMERQVYVGSSNELSIVHSSPDTSLTHSRAPNVELLHRYR